MWHPRLHADDLVYLPFAKTNRRPELLGYQVLPSLARQPRFRGRLLVKPALDLDRYRCRAVMDWLQIDVELRRASQFQHIQRLAGRDTITLPYVEPVGGGAGGAARKFSIRIQEPRLRAVEDIVSRLEATYGLEKPVAVTGLEVSIDFYPMEPSDRARALMVAVLARHLLPTRDILSDPSDRPRFTGGGGLRRRQFVVGARNRSAPVASLNRSPDDDKVIPVDATFYLGKKAGAASWRVMDKVVDQQRPDGSVKYLPEGERRARVEVTLDRSALNKHGIHTLEDLKRFSFTRFQGSCFRFFLPTFAQPLRNDPVGREQEARRRKRFYNGGVSGLVIMDRTLDALRELHRPEIRKVLRLHGTRLAPRQRLGDALLAYAGLNDVVSDALEKLGKREMRG